jgi:hypothetical protein
MGDFILEISKPTRPVAKIGMITTFLGDAYANFRHFGLILVPYLLAYWSGRAYFRAYRSNYMSVARFSYLLLACNLIQVYRDGLKSIVTFIAANMMPLFIIVLLHPLASFFGVKATPRRMPARRGEFRQGSSMHLSGQSERSAGNHHEDSHSLP